MTVHQVLLCQLVFQLKWPSFVSPYIKVDCPDGPRFILKKPERAFSIIAADWNARIKAILKAFKLAEANVEVEVAKRFKGLIENLGRNYAELQAHYQAAYLHFAGNPCSKEASQVLAKANDEIRRMEFKLREIEIKTEEILKVAKLREKREFKREYRGFKVVLDEVSAILDDIEKLVSEFH